VWLPVAISCGMIAGGARLFLDAPPDGRRPVPTAAP